MVKYIINIHKSYRQVVAICDSELVGQKIEENEKQLDLTGNFFKGTEYSKEEAKNIIIDCVREDATFNIAGGNSCELAKELGVISASGIRKIKNTPYALVLL